MMDMLTAPRGPTELTDEEGTPMFDPYKAGDGEMPPQPTHIEIQTTDDRGEDIEGELEVEGARATLRFPRKTPKEEEEEAEIEVPVKDEPMPPMGLPAPPPPQSG